MAHNQDAREELMKDLVFEDNKNMKLWECAEWYGERLKTFAMFASTNELEKEIVRLHMDKLSLLSNLFTSLATERGYC